MEHFYPYELVWNCLFFERNTEINFDIKDRFHSFNTWQDWKTYACKKSFKRMDFGDTSFLSPQFKELKQFKQKVLVFDIDMDDYNQKRTCECVNTCCALCWIHCVHAFKDLNSIFTKNFNMNLHAFFSGRRGMHIYCLNEEMSYLDMYQRQNLSRYVNSCSNILTDYAVTANKSHMLKMPFIYHPTTKLLCQYIDNIDDFIPENAITMEDGIEFYQQNVIDFKNSL